MEKSSLSELILLLEIGAYLHDIGKLSSYFIFSKAKGSAALDFHGQILFLDYKTGKISQRLYEFLNTDIYKLLNIDKTFKDVELNFSLLHMVCAHHGCSRCLKGGSCPLKDIIEDFKVMALLKTADHMDASNPLDVGKQGFFDVYIDKFFKKEKVPVKKLNKMRSEIYNKLDEVVLKYDKKEIDTETLRNSIIDITKVPFLKTLSETRLYANDITLFDHSLATSTLFKAYLSAYFYFDFPFPKNFSTVRYNYIKFKKDEVLKHNLEISYALSNVVYEDDFFYTVYPAINRKSVKNTLKQVIGEYEIIKDPYELFPSYKDFLSHLKVKDVEAIKENYTEKEALLDVKRVVYFAMLKEKEEYAKKMKSFTRHLKNVSKGIAKNKNNFVKFLKKLIELKALKKHIEAPPQIEQLRKFLGVQTSKDFLPYLEEYFDLITSPIRPPSPKEMSKMFLKFFRKTHSFKKVLMHFVLVRPMTLGRVIAFGRAVKVYKDH